jgi:hypothetical protein
MAATFTFNAREAAQFAESTVRDAVTFTLPQIAVTQSGMTAASAEFTGTSSNNMAIGPGGLLSVNATNQADPVTGVTLDFDDYWYLGLSVGRAASDTAPTGSLIITSNGFGGLNTNGANITAGENFALKIYHGVDRTATNGETLTVNLSGTTGYKVSVLVVGQAD